MTETVNYPLPTVHLNGTSKKMLLGGNLAILNQIDELGKAINACEFHGRDYYVNRPSLPDGWTVYVEAVEERQKHLQALAEFKEYIENHVTHISHQ